MADLEVTALATDGYWMAVCGTTHGAVYKRAIVDSAWQDITSPLFGTGPITSVALGWGTIYVVSQGVQANELHGTYDGGQTWQPLAPGEPPQVVASCWFGGDGVWAGCSNGAVAVSSDSGQTWDLSNPFSATVTCSCLLPWHWAGTGWAASDSGDVARTCDGGATWSPEGSGLETVLCMETWINTLLAGTGDGIFKLEGAPAEDPPLPGSLRLKLRPNPSLSGPTVEFHLAGDSHVRVSVRDLLGRRQRVFDQVSSVAGPCSLALDGGKGLCPGIYVCTVQAAGRTVSRRFVVIGP